MPISEARKRSNKKWDQEHMKDYIRLQAVVKRDKADIIYDRAKELNKPVSKYINDLIDKDLKE